MSEDQVGVVVNFYTKPCVAAIKVINGSIRKGDMLKYKGHTTDFSEEITSMEIENQPAEEAEVGDLVGVEIRERVRERDKVYKVVE